VRASERDGRLVAAGVVVMLVALVVVGRLQGRDLAEDDAGVSRATRSTVRTGDPPVVSGLAVAGRVALPGPAAAVAVGGDAVWLAGPYTQLLHGGGIVLRVDPVSGRLTGWLREPLGFLQDVVAAGPRGAWVGTAVPELLHVVPA
jgi:hypothetical protein